MKKNSYDRANDSALTPPGKSSNSLTEAGGTFDASPDPGFSEYKHSTGPNTIPVKFRDAQPTSKAPTNLVMGANGESGGMKAPMASSSTVNKKKNNYDSACDNKGSLGHY